MIALDTNVLARLLLRDDERQYQRAYRLLSRPEEFTAPVTVLVELVWVLEANGCSRQEIADGLERLLGLPNFTPDRSDSVRHAMRWFAQGLDFADALHLALSSGSAELATFDKAFARRGERLGVAPPVVAL